MGDGCSKMECEGEKQNADSPTPSLLDKDLDSIKALNKPQSSKYCPMTELESMLWAERQETNFVLRHAFSLTYRHIKKLGAGGQGEVHQVERVRDGANFAAKFTNVDKQNRDDLVELAVMKECKSPYLVGLHDAFECWAVDCKFLRLPKLLREGPSTRLNVVVMELVETEAEHGSEPDLMTYIIDKLKYSPMPEDDLATVVRNIAKGLLCLNETSGVHGIHRDLKPENVLVPPEGVSHLKVTDYGLSRIGIDTEEDSFIGTYAAGTPGYVAPEMRQRLAGVTTKSGKPTAMYGAKADIWSLGVLMFICVEGVAPFGLGHRFDARMSLRFSMKWRSYRNGARGLCSRMLEPDPDIRPSVHTVLQDRWVKAHAAPLLTSLRRQTLPVVMSMPEPSPAEAAPEDVSVIRSRNDTI